MLRRLVQQALLPLNRSAARWLIVCLTAGILIAQSGQAQTDDLAALNRQVLQLYQTGDYAKASVVAKRALALAENNLGPNHQEVGTSLNNLAELYAILGRYADAEPLHKRALTVREKVLGPRHSDVGESLNNLATLYANQGRTGEAEPLLKRSLSIFEKAHGADHPKVGAALNNLAFLYEKLGRATEAEQLHKRALAISEKAHGPDHPDVALSLNNLAAIYYAQGRNTEAELLLVRALVIRERAHGPHHPSVAETLNNLAENYYAQGRLSEAEPLYKRALAIIERVLGPDHPVVGKALNNLAGIYYAHGRYSVAESLFRRTLSIFEKALGSDHPDVGTTLNDLALLYQAQDLSTKAEPFYKRALAIYQQSLRPDHPNVGQVFNNLGVSYFLKSDWMRATNYLRHGAGTIVRRSRRGVKITGQGLTGMRQSDAARSSRELSLLVKSAYRLSQTDGGLDAKLSAEMFQMAQWAALSEAAVSLAQMAARQAKGNGGLARLVRERQDLVHEWQKRDALRSAAFSQPPNERNPTAEAASVDRLAVIDKRIAGIDKRLASVFPNYSALASPEPSSIAEVQKYLQANEALVLFLDTLERKPAPQETFIWVVTKQDSRWVRSNLGPKTLKDHVDALRCGLDFDGAWTGARCFNLLNAIYTQTNHDNGKALPFSLRRAYALYRSLFGKVDDLIEGKDLLIVPSGPLTQLPFQVLVTKKPEQDRPTREVFSKASWLAKRHAITVLPSVASLKTLRVHAKSSKAAKPFVGFGNPLLDGDTDDRWQQEAAKLARSITGCAGSDTVRTAQLRAARQTVLPLGRGTRLADLEHIRFQVPLPETADELCRVARTAGARTEDVYLGHSAIEAGLKNLSETGALAQYKVIHFATHGALAGELEGSKEPGLILSPPVTATARDDGYLSSSEVAGLKLDADWVILSACNTAGGNTENAKALSGLARAFFYAGARALLVSHWYVDSQATVALITKAFAEMKRDPSIGRSGALRHAMLSLIGSGERTWHPSYWAPFVVVGEGAN